MREWVYINEVGPRDGLQNQPQHLSPAQRLSLIRALREAGVDNIEVGAFVSPKVVPAMAGSDEVAKGIEGSHRGYSALIPNVRGYEMAQASGLKSVAMVLYGSDAMAEKNVRMQRSEAEAATLQILQRAQADDIAVIATIAVSFHCPFAGPTDRDTVRGIAERCLNAGAARVVIADTIGAANPAEVDGLLGQLVQDNGPERLACHLHDTRALGMANLFAALQVGVRHFDASIAGLGGCPFAPGASGNIATEDAVMLLHSMGYDTGIDLRKLLAASDLADSLTGSAPGGRSKPWLAPWLERGNRL